MSEFAEKNLGFAKRLADYLGSTNLPRELMDDRRLRVDSEARTPDEVLMAHFNEDSLSSMKTVRFLKDFYRYGAVPDRETKNESFKRTAEVFRLQGIKNYYFLLQLNNPLLKGVDPHDPDISNELATFAFREVKENFWYFIREVCQLKPGMPFLANRGNISFIWAYLNHITTYMIMPRQQGKLQRRSSKVRVKPTATGGIVGPRDCWKQIGDLVVGDQVIDRHGDPCTVIGVHPQGKKRLYLVVTEDGRSTDAGPEHLWTVKDYSNVINGRALWNDYSTADLIELHQKGVRLQLPNVDPLPGIKQKHAIDPYLMGLLYAGKNTGGGVRVSTPSVEAELYVQNNLSSSMKAVSSGNHAVITRKDGPLSIERKAGLPLSYLEGALEDRLAVLQAFLDTIGVIGEGKVRVTHNRVVCEQLCYIARSLGGCGTIVGDAVDISLPVDLEPFKFRRDEVEFDNRVFIKSITFAGDDECSCIEVDNSEHLYITDDFMVTHNTVSVQVINFWLTYIYGRGYMSHLITLKSDNRAQFINAVKVIRSSMPPYMINATYKDKDSGTYLNYKAYGEDKVNVLTINVPQQGRDKAGDLGRGLSVGTTNFDEPAYISFIDTIVDGCGPSTLTEMANCRAAGKPHGISYITTPNTTLHPSGEFMFDKLMSATEWRERFFDAFSESHLQQLLLRASPKKTTSPSVAMVYNYLQLGKSKTWAQETVDKLSMSLAKAKIDLLLMWVEDGEDRLFDDATREAINNMKRETVWEKEYRESNLYVDFFVTQEELLEMSAAEYNDHFIIGVDTSSAINKDACTIVIRSMKTGKVIGVGRYPLTFLDHVTAVIVDLLSVINNSTLVIERNYAHHMIDSLLILLPAKGMDPFKRIYNTIYQDTVRYAKEFEEIKDTKFAYRNTNFYLKYKQHFGFITTGASREVLYGLVLEAVGNTGYGINYAKLADELINLRVKGDRIDHAKNQHDDLVISWLLSYWFIKLGVNKSLYGIPAGIALTQTRNLMNANANAGAPEMDPHVVQLLDKLRARVEALTEEFLNTRDNLLALRLESEIRRIADMLPPEQARIMTIDNQLEEAKLERNKRIMNNRRQAA